MGLSFLAPLFLAGLAAITVPILVHLTHRERKDALRFPSLMFVRRVPHRVTRRQRIRNWLVFLMRVAALTLLAGAFARPLLDRGGSVVAFSGAREVVVLLDRSHSMAYADRWRRALDAAGDLIAGLGVEDRATIVLFDEQAEAISQPSSDPVALRAALDGATVGFGATRYGPALQLAREILERSDRPRGEVALISDFQASGWDPAQVTRLPEGSALQLIDLSDHSASNLAVTGISLARSRSGDRQHLTVTATLTNHGGRELSSVPVALELDGAEVATAVVDVAAGATSSVQFRPVVMSTQTQLGVVRAGDDALPADNAFRFVAAPDAPVRVLVVDPRGAAGTGYGLYLARALRIGDRPEFALSTASVGAVRANDLDDRDVVILNDAPMPSGAAGERLRRLVAEGGGLLVILGSRTPPTTWPPEGSEMLPVSFGGAEDRPDGGRLGLIDFDHPALQPFRAPRSGDFTTPRFFRYRRMEPKEGARALVRFDDGSPALVEGTWADGRVAVFASDVSNYWSDFVVQPVFLPFIHQVVKQLAGYTETPAWARVGAVVDLAARSPLWEEAIAAGVELVIESPTGRRVVRPADEPALMRLDAVGFYRLWTVGGEGTSGAGGFSLASNLQPAESDVTRVDPDEVAVAVVTSGDGEGGDAAASVVLTDRERERRQGLWWYLLVVAAGLLLLETALANRASNRVRRRVAI